MIKKIDVKMALLTALVSGVVLAPFVFTGPVIPGVESITVQLAEWGGLAPFVYMVLMAFVVATPIPSLPLNFAAGAFFGPFPGTLYSVTGATCGALISFTLARYLGRGFIERFLKGHIHFCTPCSDKLLAKVVFFARLVPVFSFDLISYGAGLTMMSVRNFILANFLGMIPLTFAFNYFGSAFIVDRGLSIAFGAVMVAMFFLLPGWIERRNLFSLRRFFEHPPEENSRLDEKHLP